MQTDDFETEEPFFSTFNESQELQSGEVKLLIRILKKAGIYYLPYDDAASVCLSLEGACEFIKSEAVLRSLSADDKRLLLNYLPDDDELRALGSCMHAGAGFSYADKDDASAFLHSWLKAIGARYDQSNSPVTQRDKIAQKIYDEARRLEEGVRNVRLNPEKGRSYLPSRAAMERLMSPDAPDHVKKTVGQGELALTRAGSAVGIISTLKQNAAVKKLDDEAMIFYVAIMRICAKQWGAQGDPYAFLRYRLMRTADNERRRCSKQRRRFENFFKEVLEIEDIKGVSDESVRERLSKFMPTLKSERLRSTASLLLKAFEHRDEMSLLHGSQRQEYIDGLSEDEYEAFWCISRLKDEFEDCPKITEAKTRDSTAKFTEEDLKTQSNANELLHILQIFQKHGFVSEERSLLRALRGGEYEITEPPVYSKYKRERVKLQKRVVQILKAQDEINRIRREKAMGI